jgi:host factor-I protein
MNRNQGNLQDAFLNAARRENVGVTVYLVSGHQLRGTIRAFDAFTILLEMAGRPPQLVYKHAVTSISPARPVNVDGAQAREATGETIAERAQIAAPEVEAAEDLPERTEREVEVAP